ncbi:MAG: hypothetical protein F4Y14_02515, partial [Acidobacteria bacterium]|nr:hypothetical protein [Acidobacteriota bacterium]
MNPLIAVLITGVAMFVAHIAVILLFREKPAASEKAEAEAEAPARTSAPAALVGAATKLADRVVSRKPDDESPLMGRRGWM